jgi:hypothetical protein
MNAQDRIKYFSIVTKINQGNFDQLDSEEMVWLQSHPDLISDMKNGRYKQDVLRKCPGVQDTIEEILFLLDLSDTMYK